MKTKKIVKKLIFNKVTISDLNETQMSGLHGGVTTLCPTVATCDTCLSLEDCTFTKLCDLTMEGYTCVWPQTGCWEICEL